MQKTMLNMPASEAVHVPAEEFVALAEAILAKKNVDKFEDDWVLIERSHNNSELTITRCKQNVQKGEYRDHLRVPNPTTMVIGGDIIRHHGEHCYLTAHMRDLLAD